MSPERKLDIKRHIEHFHRSYQQNGEPISVSFRSLAPELNKAERYTHQIHSYPAKLLTNIPYFFLATDALCLQNGIVLDPFCGTGTVLLEASLSGRPSFGADSNPLAELITSVKTNYISREELIETQESILHFAKGVKETAIIPKAVAAWYSPSTLPQLVALQSAINQVNDDKQKAFFELCFSSLVRKVSLADPSISVPVHLNPYRFNDNIHRKQEVELKIRSLKTVDVFDKFESMCKVNIGRVESLRGTLVENVEAKIISNDARSLGLSDNSVDLILTSPPYAGAQKYIRASWLNLYWLNRVRLEEIKELKKQNIGREDYRKGDVYECYSGISPADAVLKDLYQDGKIERAFIVANYLNEMKVALDESIRVLKEGAFMVIVIGNNTVCKRSFDTQDYLTHYLVGKGMNLQFKLIDDIKSYGLMTKRNKTADKITREWVLVFKK